MARRRAQVEEPAAPSQMAPAASAPVAEVKLGDLLVQHGLLTQGQLSQTLLQQRPAGKRIGELLVDLGLVDERGLARVIAEQQGLDVVDLRVRAPEPEAAALLPEEAARSLVALPLMLDDDYLEVAVSDPTPEAVQVVNLLLTQALRDRASDVHLEPQEERIRVRYRIDGALHDIVSLPGAIGPALSSRIKIMANMNIVERRRPQDGQIALELEGRPLDIRVATGATIWGEKIVLRLLDKSRPLYRLRDLGMPEDTALAYEERIHAPFGLMLCAGPTGSGKTTTLYASLQEINRPELNIMTIEDPVEYILPSISQIQINEQTGVGFSTGLRSILRQDPDVILVGEIRDPETARITVRAALTGHLVLSSLHATDAASALQRFLDMGIEPFLVASSVQAVVAQRLVRRICSYCAVVYKPPADEMSYYMNGGGEKKATFYRGEGCNFCAQTGYQDRIGVYEFMRVTEEIRELIVGGLNRDTLRRLAVEQGMSPLMDEGLRLVNDDVTTISEVIRSLYIL
ncbi:MAG: Flp pilus assembly complex ATPase component TadA [Actinobacteria bacterium]|nr:Flp pilus assembly complex ATPase component TadA [Actinomycetota bacterium]